MPSYASLRTVQDQLIRRGLDGGVWVAPYSAPAITTLTSTNAATLTALPTGYKFAGHLDSNGLQFGRTVNRTEITPWGAAQPARSDVQSDVTTLQVSMLETNAQSLGLGIGFDPSTITPTATTGEVQIDKPARPKSLTYRVLAMSRDDGPAGDIYIARFFPAATVSDHTAQNQNDGSEPIAWGVTFTPHQDAVLGYSERNIFAGPGWLPLLTAMGFPAAGP